MERSVVTAPAWVIQASGLPLFLRPSGKFGSLEVARIYRSEYDAMHTINYHGLDSCRVVEISMTCEITVTESRARLEEAISRLSGRIAGCKPADVELSQ